MNTKALRVFSLIMGLIVVAFGITMLFFPMEAYAMIVFLIPVIILLHGVSCLASYFGSDLEASASGWVLADGILSSIVGGWLLFSPDIMAMSLPMIFGFWILFAGVLRIISSITIRNYVKAWIWLLLLGIVGVLLGIFLLNHLVLAGEIITYLSIVCFILMGIMSILQFFLLKNVEIEVETMLPEKPETKGEFETD